jgi:hypothetical protein
VDRTTRRRRVWGSQDADEGEDQMRRHTPRLKMSTGVEPDHAL